MESKDDEIVRFSDLIKGVSKKGQSEQKETSDDASPSEDGPLRFSDLEALKSKSRLVKHENAMSKTSVVQPQKDAAAESRLQSSKKPDLSDFEEYKQTRSRDSYKSPPVVKSGDSDPGLMRKDERIRSAELAVPVGKIPRETDDVKNAANPPEVEKREPEKGYSTSIEQPLVDVRKLYDDARFYLEKIKGKVIANQRFEIEPARNIIEKMSDSRERIEALYPLTTKTIEEEDYNISHQTNVAIYAIKLGSGLGYSGEKLIELGLCSLMHDIGMFRIPDGIRLKREKLTGQEGDIIKTHPDIGRDILQAFRGNDASLSVVAYEHHEREGGQGYPRGLQGNDIHEFARIVAITDSYEAMTHHRPYRKALLQPLSAKELIKQKNALFAPFVIKVFLQEISLYPPGSYVLLNNRAVAVVVASDKNHPLRPDVKILFDGEGNKVYSDVIIKLAQNPLFFIVDGISQDEIPKGK